MYTLYLQLFVLLYYYYLPRIPICLQLFTHPDFEILNFQEKSNEQQSIPTFTTLENIEPQIE